MQTSLTPPVTLTIAGSDSGGGAGVQADLKTFAFHQVHGASVLTCVTAQNTCGVTRVDALSSEAVLAQLNAVVSDFDVKSAKLGMLLNAGIMQAVAQSIPDTGVEMWVVDPVMVSRTGSQLIDEAAIVTLRDALVPLATVLTPNRHEAQLLSGLKIATLADMEAAAQKIHALGPQAVLVKGGGMGGNVRGIDVWFDGKELLILKTEAVETTDTHGTGCTLAAAIAANLALGHDPLAAARKAKLYVTQALQHSLRLGKGQGPVGHFYPLLADRSQVDSQSEHFS
ncbi:MAG: bifunctional hydroxymethylpyrimidine kinase/phosphomethylpyrimidine kinase [Leptolyngbyaceae cyanobacterium]